MGRQRERSRSSFRTRASASFHLMTAVMIALPTSRTVQSLRIVSKGILFRSTKSGTIAKVNIRQRTFLEEAAAVAGRAHFLQKPSDFFARVRCVCHCFVQLIICNGHSH